VRSAPAARLPSIVFGALVASTFAAFFVAQRLKHDPSPVQQYHQQGVLSPNGDGRLDTQRINFKLTRADDITIEVLDSKGDAIRELVDDRAMPAYRPTRFVWDGKDDDGRIAPDGRYRMRITLRKEGRSIVWPDSFVLDTKRPVVAVLSIGPKPKSDTPQPKFLPSQDGLPARIRFSGPARRSTGTIFRTAPGRITRVFGPAKIADGVRTWQWDGNTKSDGPAPPGSYVVVITSRDKAGNIGTSVPLTRRTGLPVTSYGTPFPGRGGITIRRLGVLPPYVPTAAGALGQVGVDSRTATYNWSLRRVGGPKQPQKRGVRDKPLLKLHGPPGVSRLFLLSVRANGVQQRVPYPVQSATLVAGPDAARPHGVLVVLPAITWQGRNPVDDDGDGLPNVLDRGLPVRLARVFSGDGLPQGFLQNEGPLFSYLDRQHHRYDLTTDVALTRAGTAPDLRRYNGVLIAGDARWLPATVGRALRSFAKGGGTVVSLGTDSLRREVQVTPHQRLIDPTPPAATDLFGAQVGPLTPGPDTTVENVEDKIGLFDGGTGSFSGYGAYERTLQVGREAKVVASAVATGDQPVIVAATFGKGLVIRTGLKDFASHLNRDRNAAALMESMWHKLSR
jgi:flagellar hook assembly protein FlgD